MGKVIVITGANGGLGRALARGLAEDGHHVVLLGRNLSKVQAVAAEIGELALAVECDVASPASVKAAFAALSQWHPEIDVLVNGAAIFQPFLLAETSDEQLMAPLLTNLAGPILCARSAIPLLKRGGHIINVSSESVALPFPHLTLYQASKGGLEAFSEHLAREVEDRGIRVTTVRAGQMGGAEGAALDNPEAAMRFYTAALARGLDLGKRGTTQYDSTLQIFRTVIASPPDLKFGLITFQGRPAD